MTTASTVTGWSTYLVDTFVITGATGAAALATIVRWTVFDAAAVLTDITLVAIGFVAAVDALSRDAVLSRRAIRVETALRTAV